MKYRDKSPERGKWCDDIGAQRGAPNKTWGRRRAEGHLEDEVELARRRLVLVESRVDKPSRSMSSLARSEKDAVSLTPGMRECAEGGGEGSPSLGKVSYLSPRSSETLPSAFIRGEA